MHGSVSDARSGWLETRFSRVSTGFKMLLILSLAYVHLLIHRTKVG